MYLIESDRTEAEDPLKPLLAERPLQVEAGKGLRLDPAHIDYLGKSCIEFLNALEALLEAWLNQIADQKIIERQLECVVKASEGRRGFSALEGFRDALKNLDHGRNKYPATREFVRRIVKGSAPLLLNAGCRPVTTETSQVALLAAA